MNAVASPRSYAAWRPWTVVIMLFLFQTLNFFDKLSFGLSAVPIMHDMGLSPKEFGLVGSSFYLLFSLSGVVVGLWVIGRISAKWILVILALIWSASQIPIFFTNSVAVLVICRILLGLGEGPGLPTALYVCHNWFSPDRRSVPNAVVLQGISVGLLAGGPILTWVILSFGWHAAFLFCGILSLTWLAVWLVIGREGPYADEGPEEIPGTLSEPVPTRQLWLNKTVIGVIIMSTMSYWIVGMSANWLPPFLEVGLGYGAKSTGDIISGIFVFQSPLLLVGSWIAQRMLRSGVSHRNALGNAAGAALLVAGLALIGAIESSGALQLVLIAIAFAAPALTTVYGPITLGSIAPSVQRGRLIVTIYSANAFSALFSNAVTGMIVQAGGTHGAARGYDDAMLFTAGILIIGAIAAFALIFPERTLARFAAARKTSAMPQHA